jgi:hypothetical protein
MRTETHISREYVRIEGDNLYKILSLVPGTY